MLNARTKVSKKSHATGDTVESPVSSSPTINGQSDGKDRFHFGRRQRRILSKVVLLIGSLRLYDVGLLIALFSVLFLVNTQIIPRLHDDTLLIGLSAQSEIITRNDDDIIFLDTAVHKNVEATLKGATSRTEWDVSMLGTVTLQDNLHKFQVVPLMATVDRRPMTARVQIIRDKKQLYMDGSLLGCAFSATTFVSNLRDLSVSGFKSGYPHPTHCDICFQFPHEKICLTFCLELDMNL